MNKTRSLKERQLLGETHEVCDLIGLGRYAYVAKCLNNETGNKEAVKIIKKDPEMLACAKEELAIMTQLQCLDPDTCNIVRCHGYFYHKEMICLRFELLDQNLVECMCTKDFSMAEIKAIIHQMATALLHLRSLGIIHANIKPADIVVVDRKKEPMKVKLIDFGSAHPVSEVKHDQNGQNSWYRAPEMIIGAPYNEAVDIWSLGLVAAELATGLPLFNGMMEYNVLRFIIQTQGQPPDHLLDSGTRTDLYFKKNSSRLQRWRLKTYVELPDEEYDSEARMFLKISFLDDLKDMMAIDAVDNLDQHLWLDLIKKMLHLDPNQRINPQEILQHRFLANNPSRSHANNAMEMINSDAKERVEVNLESSRYPTAQTENDLCEDKSPTNTTDDSPLRQCHDVVQTFSEGSFGCVKKTSINTGQVEAIKRHKEYVFFAKKDIAMLNDLQHLSETCNIVKWNSLFVHEDVACLTFELLYQSPWDHQKERNTGDLCLTEIRSIIHQLATVLEHLRNIDIIHADVTAPNIMVGERHQHPQKLILIDNGLAHPSEGAGPDTCVRRLWYRAPEVMLGMPYDEAIDMWTLGLIAAELVMGSPLYPGASEYGMLSLIVQVQGQPADHLLDQGQVTAMYFNRGTHKQCWSFKTHAQFNSETGSKLQKEIHGFTRLDDLCKYMAEDEKPERNLLLLDLIKRMLHLDSGQRIKLQDVLQHPFMTTETAIGPCTSEHIRNDAGGVGLRQQGESTTASMSRMTTMAPSPVIPTDVIKQPATAQPFHR